MGAAPLRPKARPSPEASGRARFCSARNRVGTPSRALLAPAVRFVRKAFVYRSSWSVRVGTRTWGWNGEFPKRYLALPRLAGTVGARRMPGVPTGTFITSSCRISLLTSGGFSAVLTHRLARLDAVEQPVSSSNRVPAHRNGAQSIGRRNSPLSVFSGSGPLFRFFSPVQGR